MSDIEIVQQAARTGTTGTQDFTFAGFGTPKGALFFVTFGTVAGTAVNHAMLAIGATDGTNSRAIVIRAEDNVAASDASNHEATTNLIRILDVTTQASAGLAGFSAWITDGVRINWSAVPSSAYLVTCVLFGGTGVASCYVGTQTMSGIQDASPVVITLGVAPDVIFLFTHLSSFNDTLNTPASMSLGICVNDGANPPSQRCIGWADNNTTTSTSINATFNDRSTIQNVTSGTGATEGRVENITATGFSVYNRLGTAAIAFAYFAVKLNCVSSVVTTSSPVVTGSSNIIGAGFTPQFGMVLGTATIASQVNVVDTSTDAEVCGISVFTATTQACMSIYSQDAVATTNTESVTAAIPVHARKGNADFIKATFSTFTTDGCALNYSVVDGTARKRAALFIQATVAPPPPEEIQKLEFRAAP